MAIQPSYEDASHVDGLAPGVCHAMPCHATLARPRAEERLRLRVDCQTASWAWAWAWAWVWVDSCGAGGGWAWPCMLHPSRSLAKLIDLLRNWQVPFPRPSWCPLSSSPPPTTLHHPPWATYKPSPVPLGFLKVDHVWFDVVRVLSATGYVTPPRKAGVHYTTCRYGIATTWAASPRRSRGPCSPSRAVSSHLSQHHHRPNQPRAWPWRSRPVFNMRHVPNV